MPPSSAPSRPAIGSDWGGAAPVARRLSVTFVSGQAAASPAVAKRLADGGRELVAVEGTRGLTRTAFVRNRATVPIEIDPLDGRVTLAGRPLEVEPVDELPLNRRYWLR